MPHGALDYTHITQSKIVAASVELDLPLILLDRFDSANFLWVGSGTGAGWVVARNAADAYEGDAGLQLETRAVGGAPGDTVTAQRYAVISPTTKLSFSALYRPNQSPGFITSIEFLIVGRYQDRQYTTGFRHRINDNRFDYYNQAAGWTEFLTDVGARIDSWNRIYFEIDLANLQYLSFEASEYQVNLSGTPINHIFLAGDRWLEIQITLTRRLGIAADASLDNIILKELGS